MDMAYNMSLRVMYISKSLISVRVVVHIILVLKINKSSLKKIYHYKNIHPVFGCVLFPLYLGDLFNSFYGMLNGSKCFIYMHVHFCFHFFIPSACICRIF